MVALPLSTDIPLEEGVEGPLLVDRPAFPDAGGGGLLEDEESSFCVERWKWETEQLGEIVLSW